MNQAFSQTRPIIFNSDQRSHFTSTQYIQRLKDHTVRISMDRKGRALDNIITERFWRNLKYEEVYLTACETPATAYKE